MRHAACDARIEELEHENARLRKIRDVLVRRVERSMDLQGSEFALFERATLLEAEVRKRTAQREQTLVQLQHSNGALGLAKSAAEAANLSKTRFLAAASHDLLQPLNAARLFLAALAETEQPAHATRLIANVETAFESVERLLSALLDISKLDAGVVTPVITDVPLGLRLQQLIAEFTPVAERKGLALRLVPTAAVVRTDGDMLVRALMNLVSNAIRYTRHGGVLIGVRRQGERQLRIEVCDSGIGIAPDRQVEIFEEFRRLNTDADQHDRGFGLGLAIVERIARILNHPLSVRSEPGRGSCFGLSLPLGLQPSAAPATVGEPEADPGSKGALLVVIENEPAIRAGMRVLLERWGYRVVTAASGELALDQLRHARCRPAALIADYHLDGATGTGAIALVRAGLGIAVPAAIITADRTSEVCREVAALDLPLLNKPVRPAQLRALLLHLLEPA